MLPRVRTVRECIEELRAEDPNTAITEHYLRTNIKKGKSKVIWAGNRTLLNYDALCDFLAEGEPALQKSERKYGEIRPVHQ